MMRRRISSRGNPFVLVLALIGALVTAAPSYAELVLPSSRVVSSLNVRSAPTTSSGVVAKLHPGDAVVLVGPANGWYQVSLRDGATGYVSKAWSSLEADLRLGAWNLKKLGHGSSKDYQSIAAVIDANFDILTVIEVMQRAQAHPGYDALLQALGFAWKGVITSTPRPNTTSGNSEFYAIVYRPNVVRPCGDGPALQYFPDNDGGPQSTGADNFVREPAFACFEAVSESGARGWDFMLAGYHATWADGNQHLITAEAAHLSEVFAAMRAARPGEIDLFVAGDFNLTPDILDGVVSASDMTSGDGSTLNSKGDRSGNLYDHLLIFDKNATSELVMGATVLDVRGKVSSNKVFYQTVSDHLPIMGRFVRDKPDDD